MRLILTNSEARKLLSDASLIGRDLFARGAAKAAESVRPDQDALARVDDAAPADEWVGPQGTTHGPNDPAPDVLTDEQARNAQQGLDAAKQARDVKGQVTGQATDLARDTLQSDDKAGTAQRGFNDRLDENKDQVPQEHRETAGAVAGDAQQVRPSSLPSLSLSISYLLLISPLL